MVLPVKPALWKIVRVVRLRGSHVGLFWSTLRLSLMNCFPSLARVILGDLDTVPLLRAVLKSFEQDHKAWEVMNKREECNAETTGRASCR